MAIIHVNQNNFEREVLNAPVPVLVDFNATWCGPCRMLKPVLEQLAAERTDCRIAAVDVDENEQLAYAYGISSIPCLILFRDGAEVKRTVGLQPKQALEALLGD